MPPPEPAPPLAAVPPAAPLPLAPVAHDAAPAPSVAANAAAARPHAVPPSIGPTPLSASRVKALTRALDALPIFTGEKVASPEAFNAWCADVLAALGDACDDPEAASLVTARLSNHALTLYNISKPRSQTLRGTFLAMRRHYEPLEGFDAVHDLLYKMHQRDDEPVVLFDHRLGVQADVYDINHESYNYKLAFINGLRPALREAVHDALLAGITDTAMTTILTQARRKDEIAKAKAIAPVATVAAVAAAAPAPLSEIEELRVAVVAIQQQVARQAAGQRNTQPYRFNGSCNYCHIRGHKEYECRRKAAGQPPPAAAAAAASANATMRPSLSPAVPAVSKGFPPYHASLVALIRHSGAMTCKMRLRHGPDDSGHITALVDTGAEVSLISRAALSDAQWRAVRWHPDGAERKLVSASGTEIIPSQVATLSFALDCDTTAHASTPTLNFDFYVVDALLPECILGADFLHTVRGNVDCARPRLTLLVNGLTCAVPLSAGPDWQAHAAAAALAVRRRTDLERMGTLVGLSDDEQLHLPPPDVPTDGELEADDEQCVPSMSPTWPAEVDAALRDFGDMVPPGIPVHARERFQHLLAHLVAPAARPLLVPRDADASPLPYQLHIKLLPDAVPAGGTTYRLSEPRAQALEANLDELKALGFISASESAWAHPVLMVPKGPSVFRMCIDLRQVNKYTVKDSYALPHMTDILDRLAGAKFYSYLDLKSGYWQVDVHPDSRHLTAFVTKTGLFEWNRVPFGLMNAPALFQRTMETVLKGLLGKQCLVYLDDVVVFGHSLNEYLDALDAVFERLRQFDLRINIKKCGFFATQFTYLGHQVSATGIRPDPAKVQALADYPRPTTLKALRAFLGLAGWYRRFVPNFADIATPLNNMTHGQMPGKRAAHVAVDWSAAAEAAFQQLKAVIAARPVLAYPDLNNLEKPYYLYSDASKHGVGAVLMQVADTDGQQHPVGFFSATLVTYEQAYSNPEREALAVLRALRHYRPYLEGRRVYVYTDCASVAHFLANTKSSLNERLVRWGIEVSRFDMVFRHIDGVANAAADALSRYLSNEPNYTRAVPPTPKTTVDGHIDEAAVVAPVRAMPLLRMLRDENVAKLQREDLWCQGLVQRLLADERHPDLTGYELRANGELPPILLHRRRTTSDQERLFLGDAPARMVVPAGLRPSLLKMAHESAFFGAHSGARSVGLHLRRYYHWPTMKDDIIKFTAECVVCAQHAGDARHGPFTPTPNPAMPMASFAVDTVGPLPETARGNKYILVGIDHFSRWPVAAACKTADSQVFVDWLMDEVVANFGVPKALTSDNGQQFVSGLAEQTLEALGIKHHHTSGYRPTANGSVERMNKSIVDRLRRVAHENPRDWDLWLPQVLFALRTKTSRTTLFSPYELMYGRAPRRPGDPAGSAPTNPANDDELPPAAEYQHYVKGLQWRLGQAYALAREVSEDCKVASLDAANAHRAKPRPQLAVGDVVRYRLPEPGKSGEKLGKLAPRWRGPYEIVASLPPVNYTIKGLDGCLDKGVTRLEHIDNLDYYSAAVVPKPTTTPRAAATSAPQPTTASTPGRPAPQPTHRPLNTITETVPRVLDQEGENCRRRTSTRLLNKEIAQQQAELAFYNSHDGRA